ncbi:MAG: type II CAAX endopeptidase family protein [Bacillota bacterium]
MEPETERSWSLWDVLGVYAFVYLLGLLFAQLSNPLYDLFLRWFGDSAALGVTFLAGLLEMAFLAGLSLWVMRYYGLNLDELQLWPRPLLLHLFWGVVGGLGIYTVILVAQYLINLVFAVRPALPPMTLGLGLVEGAPVLLTVISGLLISPIGHELFFRGLAYPALRRLLGSGWAIVASAMLFATVFRDLWAALAYVAAGVILAWLVERTKTLFVPMVAHGVWNLLAIIGLAISQRPY